MSKEIRYYINKVENFNKLIKEEKNYHKLSQEEEKILDDILSLNEDINFKGIINKIKNYAKKGLITTAILTSLLNNNAFSQEQKKEIKNSIKIEQPQKIVGGYGVKINGEKIRIDKVIQNLKGENLSQDELEKIIKKGELDGGKIDGVFGQKFINFMTAETGPKGTDLEGNDFKIIFNKVNSNNYNAAKSSALQQSKVISKNNHPFKVTQVIVVKDGDDKYICYTFTKVAK